MLIMFHMRNNGAYNLRLTLVDRCTSTIKLAIQPSEPLTLTSSSSSFRILNHQSTGWSSGKPAASTSVLVCLTTACGIDINTSYRVPQPSEFVFLLSKLGPTSILRGAFTNLCRVYQPSLPRTSPSQYQTLPSSNFYRVKTQFYPKTQ
jgi:hypothetical protein